MEVDRGNEKVISLYWLVAFLDIGEFVNAPLERLRKAIRDYFNPETN